MVRSDQDGSGDEPDEVDGSGTRSGDARPHAPTADELEGRYLTWRTARRDIRAARTSDERSRGRRRVAGVLAAVALIGIVTVSGLDARSQNAAVATSDQSVRALDDRATALAEQAASASARPSALVDLQTRAAAAAKRVAAGQQAYTALAVKGYTTARSTSANGAPDAVAAAVINHRRALAADWSADSLVVDDADAYTFSTQDALGGQMDPRYSWFVRYDGGRPSDPSTWGWQVRSIAPAAVDTTDAAADQTDTATVVWTATQKDGTVLAWASALWHADTRVFDTLSVTLTAQGLALAPSGSVQTSADPSRLKHYVHVPDNKIPELKTSPAPTAKVKI